MRRSLVSAALLLTLCMNAGAQPDLTSVNTALSSKKKQIQALKLALESNYGSLQQKRPIGGNRTLASLNPDGWFGSEAEWPKFGLTGAHGMSLDACGTELPPGWYPTCDRTLGGDTQGCTCMGRKKVRSVTVKSLDAASQDAKRRRNAGNHAAFAAGASMAKAYKNADPDNENKWMYFGAADGSYSIYPGILWPRDYSGNSDSTKCGATYDPRVRPWYLSASNGPKNVIFILDISGSMNDNGRLAAMKSATKKMIDSLSFADFVAVVLFNSEASSLKNLEFLAPAQARFRNSLKTLVSGLIAEKGTNYAAGLLKAFEIADTSYTANYDSGFQTAYVFLTDGQQTQGSSDFVNIIKGRSTALRAETFIIIGFGDGLEDAHKEKLQAMACKGKGIYQSVADRIDSNVDAVDKSEFELVQALSLFSQYFTTKNTRKKRDLVTYSEIYEMSWGDGANGGMEVTTASVPVYDKRDASRWAFLGVVALDVTICDIEKKIVENNPNIQSPPTLPEETKFPGCRCADSYTYDGQTYAGGVCITASWPVAWCMTVNCGIPQQSMSTGYWADCKPFGARAVLEDLLLRSGEEGSTDDLDACELEALRPVDKTCGDNSVPALPVGCDISALAARNYVKKLPGFTDIEDTDWVGNSDGSYTETEWSQNTLGCDQCANTGMKPQCALPASCNFGIGIANRNMTDTAYSLRSLSCGSLLFLTSALQAFCIY